MASFNGWSPKAHYEQEEIARRIGQEDDRIPFLARSSFSGGLDLRLEDHLARKPGEFLSDDYRSMLEQERTLGTQLPTQEGEQ